MPATRGRHVEREMASKQKSRILSAGRVVDLLMDGKKTVLASSLILVMGIMWIRVLIGHKPGSAVAAAPQTQAAPVKQRESARVRLVELPKIPGRHDGIQKDCFSMRDRPPFRPSAAVQHTGTVPEVPVVSPHHDQEVVQQVAQTLKLEAVIRDGTPRAFVNDRLLNVGDRFTVERGADFLEFEVLWIYEDSVLVECNGIQLTLKLAQYVDVRK